MNNEFYFPPPTTSSIGPWMQNFTTELTPIYAQFGLTQAEMDSITADNTAIQYAVGRINIYDQAYSLNITTRNVLWTGDPDNPNLTMVVYPKQPVVITPMPANVAPNMYTRIKGVVMSLRQHPSMTESIARQLGIQAKPSSNNVTPEYMPALNGSVLNGEPMLDCPVRGFAGYEIWRALGNTNDFARFDVSVGRSYTDRTPLPEGISAELRRYKVRMLDSNNQPYGQYSNIVPLTTVRVV